MKKYIFLKRILPQNIFLRIKILMTKEMNPFYRYYQHYNFLREEINILCNYLMIFRYQFYS